MEDLDVQQFRTKSRVEALGVAVLPRRAGLDEPALSAGLQQEHGERTGEEFAAVVAPQVLRRPALLEARGRHGLYTQRLEALRGLQGQALAGVRVDDAQHLEPRAVEDGAEAEVEDETSLGDPADSGKA